MSDDLMQAIEKLKQLSPSSLGFILGQIDTLLIMQEYHEKRHNSANE